MQKKVIDNGGMKRRGIKIDKEKRCGSKGDIDKERSKRDIY